MGKKFNAVMVRCTECKEEQWGGYILQPSEATWFHAQRRLFRLTCRCCGVEFQSEPYLKGIDDLREFYRARIEGP